MLLADSSSLDPAWLSNAFTFLCAVAALWAAMKKAPAPTAIPVPLETQERPLYATAAGVQNLAQNLAEVKADLATFRETQTRELHQTELRLNAEGEKRVVKIHDRIAPLENQLHELIGRSQRKSS